MLCYENKLHFLCYVLKVIKEVSIVDKYVINEASKLLEGENADIWQTYLLNVYYTSIKWMNENKFKEMQNCRMDSDWEHVKMNFKDWLRILNKCMKETIIEKRIRKQEVCQDFRVILLQMIIVVSELFCILEQHVLKYNKSRKYTDLYINFKNHYYPKSIYNSSEFIWFIFTASRANFKSESFTFRHSLLPFNAPKSIITYNYNNRDHEKEYAKSKWEILRVIGEDSMYDELYYGRNTLRYNV